MIVKCNRINSLLTKMILLRIDNSELGIYTAIQIMLNNLKNYRSNSN